MGGVFLAALILAQFEGLTFHDYGNALLVLGAAALILLYGYIRRVEAFVETGDYVLLWLSFIGVNAMFAYAVARWRLPLRDRELSGIDAAIGFDRTALLSHILAIPWLKTVLPIAYGSLFLQALLSTVYFAFSGFSDRNRELFRMAAIACIATDLISGLIPAIGPHPLAPFQQALIDLRANSSGLISVDGMQGIVTFPSLHTAMALLLIYVHRPPCRTFLPVLALNLTMLIAIPFWGHHYFADEIAGAVVALASAYAAKKWLIPEPVLVTA